MKKLLFLLLMLPTMLMAQTQKSYQPREAYGNLPPLHVDGNVLRDVNGNKVVLHGVMDTPSMWFNSNRWGGGYNSTGATNCINYFKKLFKFLTKHEDGAYCNVFRLHMDPAWTNQNGTDFRAGFTVKDGKHIDPHGKEVGGEADIYNFSKKSYETYLKSVYVKLALEALRAGMYVVVRPCGVCPGYVEVGDYYNNYLMYIWDEFSKNDSIRKYSGQISIELANEPVSMRRPGGGNDDKVKHDFFQPIVDKIRSNGFDGIIWVPGEVWQQEYKSYAKYPITGENIGYAVHNYAGWYGNGDDVYDRTANKTTYKNNCINNFKNSVPVVETNPIIITEVDWSPKSKSSGHYNESGAWVEGNYGTWATATTSKWGVGYKALLDHFGNISMTLSSSDCYIDWNKSNSTGHSYPAFKDAMEKDGLNPYDGSGVACFQWYADYAKVDYPHAAYKRQWSADQGYGYFVNPILNGDFPDPDVIRVGDTYYMVSTTFTTFPGCTVLKSKDLVNWQYCANPLQQIANDDNYNLLNGKNHYAQGMWAASMSYHNGKFYIYFISYGKDKSEGKNILLTTTNPEGQWDMQYWPEHYYDSGWLFDDGENGDGYVYVACGIGDIWVNKLDGKTLKKISSTKVISSRDGLEGSHMYHIGDFYYLYLTTGGYWRGQTIYRSKTPMGPYEEMPNLNNYGNVQAGNAFSGAAVHQGALVETQTGEWWTILFKDAGSIGRAPYLEPVTWKDGWPIIGKKGAEVSKGAKLWEKPNVGATYPITYLPTNDTFTDLTLGLQWGWNHNPVNTAWSLLEKPGNLRMHTACVTDKLDQARNSLTQRILGYNPEGWPTSNTAAYVKKYLPSYGTIKMDVSQMAEGDVAGLSVFQDPYSYIGVKMVDGQKKLVYYRSEYDNTAAVEKMGDVIESDTIFLRAICNFYDDSCKFYYSYDNETYKEFGDGMKMRFTLKVFSGQRFYIFNYATKAMGGYVDIDWFSTEPEFSEEMFWGEGVLKQFTADDATAVELTLSQQSFDVMPDNSVDFNVTCKMKSGLVSSVTSGCRYVIADPSVAVVQGNKIVGVGEGTTRVDVIYTDLNGDDISTSFTVNCSFFPLSAEIINPSLIGSGTFKVVNGIGQLKPGGKGMGGWYYKDALNLKGKAKYLVVRFKSVSLAKPSVVLIDEDNVKSTNTFEADMTSMKELVIDLEEAGQKVDLSHIYYVAFRSKNSAASVINIEKVFLSDDGENPTAIEEIEPAFELSELVKTEIFTMDGRRHNALQRGANIVRRTYSDGRTESVKIIK